MSEQKIILPCVLVAKLPSGVRVPAVKSKFPGYETDRSASSFPDEESAMRFIRILRALGAQFEIEVEIDLDALIKTHDAGFSS